MTSHRVASTEAALDHVLATAPQAAALLAPDRPIAAGTTLTAARALEVFEDQVRSRVLDVVARELKARNQGYYTISSAGHENTAVIGSLLRPTDPCFLHYRSGALVMSRSRQLGLDPLQDTLLSFCVAAEEPASGGRHKVWGSVPGWIPPQTSTIASHLPKAVGAALGISRAARLLHKLPIPADSVVLCSFGDASVNHATALSAINSARWARRQGSAVPIVFLCEDNGIGISVETPRRWIEQTFGQMPGLRYSRADGELDEVWSTACAAIATARDHGAPVFLHLPTVRLWGHAGSDLEQTYRSVDEIRRIEAEDPLQRNARRLLAVGAATREQLIDVVQRTRDRARQLAAGAAAAPKLQTLAQVVEPLAPYDEPRVRREAGIPVPAIARKTLFGETLPEQARTTTRRTMGAHLNAAMKDEMLRRPEMMAFGEDVGRKGGVYHVTAGLQDAFGTGRVFDTLLDETSILGVAQGLGLLGYLPVPEIQYLAYIHNALDQLRSEACSTSFFSNGGYRNPMVIRIAGLAYQKGFGGHFHNDNSVGALRDIPGLMLAVPARGDDAARMLRGCLAIAAAHGRVVAFLEPIALYHERDLYESGDDGWLSDYPDPGDYLLPGEVAVHHPDAHDVLLLTYGNGVRMSLRAARRLAAAGVAARVLDIRWLNPLPVDAIIEHATACSSVVLVDECRETGGGIADAVVSRLARASIRGPLEAVTAADSYVPLGPAADLVLLGEDDIVAAALEAHSRLGAPAGNRPS
jgi:2-oxoisovalerate dehydrogenase E1 component